MGLRPRQLGAGGGEGQDRALCHPHVPGHSGTSSGDNSDKLGLWGWLDWRRECCVGILGLGLCGNFGIWFVWGYWDLICVETLGFGLWGNFGIWFVWKPQDLICVETSESDLCGNFRI